MAKVRVIYGAKYKKGVTVKKEDVIADAKNSKRIELLEDGKLSDGTEFVTVKIIV